MEYQYQPLEKDHIRILHLEPAIDSAAPLRFQLDHTHIQDAADRYEAISYCWGAPLFPHKVYDAFLGSFLSITDSLNGALRNFRHQTQARRLWADAVCICQSNDNEKSTQILLMGQIYKCASQVLVWLGEGDELAETALFACTRLSRGDTSKISTEGLPLSFLLDMEYFGRRWIIQELVSNVDVRLFCGRVNMSWARFCAALLHLFRAYPGPSPPHRDKFEKLVLLWDYHTALSRLTTHQPGIKDERGIFSLLYSFGHSKCKDPRDKRYAICGVATNVLTYHSHHKQYTPVPDSEVNLISITVDYGSSVEQVYTQFAWSALNAGYGLELLIARCDRPPAESSCQGLLSWVPD